MTSDTHSSGGEMAPVTGVMFSRGEDVDRVLAKVASVLKDRGLRVAGLIQHRGEDNGECNCRDMLLEDLETGKTHVISEDRGPEAAGCHLDWAAITAVSQQMVSRLGPQTDLLILNRFGRAESEGGGFRGAVEKALELGIPALVAVREDYRDSWAGFHGGLAAECPADAATILAGF